MERCSTVSCIRVHNIHVAILGKTFGGNIRRSSDLDGSSVRFDRTERRKKKGEKKGRKKKLKKYIEDLMKSDKYNKKTKDQWAFGDIDFAATAGIIDIEEYDKYAKMIEE